MVAAVLVFLSVLVLQIAVSAGQIEIALRRCRYLCGTRLNVNIEQTFLADLPLENELSVPETCEVQDTKIERWANASRIFLSSIGINSSESACTKVIRRDLRLSARNVIRGRPQFMRFSNADSEHVKMGSEKAARADSFLVTHELPKEIQGSCITQIHRAVLRRNASDLRGYSTDWIVSHRYEIDRARRKQYTLGWLFAFFVHRSKDARFIRLPGESNSHQVLWLNNPLRSESKYSMFANWTFEQLPQTSSILARLEETVDRLENIANEVSPSNIAILCLPLLMTIPPVSLLEKVPEKVTIWYVFATDIVATVPLLIKGVELIIGERNSELEELISLRLIGEQFGIFERWYIVCRPSEVVRRFWIGFALVVTALYFMVASSYAEFLFWRAMKYRRSRQNAMDNPDVETPVVDENHEERSILHRSFLFRRRRTNAEDGSAGAEPGTESATQNVTENSDSKLFRFLRSVIRKVLVVILSFGFQVGFVWQLSFPYTIPGGFVAISTIYLVLLYAVATKRVILFLRWKFLAGIVFGFVGGPIYLLLHALEKVKKSKAWGDVSDGANIGLATLALTVSIFFSRPYSTSRAVCGAIIFPLSLGSALVLVAMLRTTGEDRVAWCYIVHGFASGIVYGPFGFLFSRCFPEMQRKGRRNFFGGVAVGLIFITDSIFLGFKASHSL